MQAKIPVSNATAMPIYVAGAMIPPGETRHFDVDQVPAHLRPVPPVEAELETQYDAIADLAEQTVKVIVEAIPDLNDEDLGRLGDLEQAKGDSARKGVLSAVAEALLKRAEEKTGASTPPGADAGAGGGAAGETATETGGA